MKNTGAIIGAVIILVVIAFASGYYLNGTSASKTTTSTIQSTPSSTTTALTTTTASSTTSTSSTTTTIMPGTLTTTTFTANGLPVGSSFAVLYDGIMKNATISSYVGSVSFLTPTGNYSYTVLNYSNTNSNFTYYSNPYSGNLIAGSSKSIIFTKGALQHTTATNTLSNTTTTTTTINQSSNYNPNCISPVTVVIGGKKATCYAFTIELYYLSPIYANTPSSGTFKITYHNTDGSTSTVAAQGIIAPGHSTTYYKAGQTLTVYVNQTSPEYTGGGSATISLNYTPNSYG